MARVADEAVPSKLPVTLPIKDEAVIDPLVFIVCVIAPDVSPVSYTHLRAHET